MMLRPTSLAGSRRLRLSPPQLASVAITFVVVLTAKTSFCAVADDASLEGDEIPLFDPLRVDFIDADPRTTHVAGRLTIERDLGHENHTDSFAVYFAPTPTSVAGGTADSSAIASKLMHPLGYAHAAVMENIRLPTPGNPRYRNISRVEVLIPVYKIPPGAVALVVISANDAVGEKSNSTAFVYLDQPEQATEDRVATQRYVYCDTERFYDYPHAVIDDGSGNKPYLSATDAAAMITSFSSSATSSSSSSLRSYSCGWTVDVSRYGETVTSIVVQLTAFNVSSSDTLRIISIGSIGGGEGGIDDEEVVIWQGGFETSINAEAEAGRLPLILRSSRMRVEWNVSSSTTDNMYPGWTLFYSALGDDTRSDSQPGANAFGLSDFEHQVPLECVCEDASCAALVSDCIADSTGNGKGETAKCENRGSCVRNACLAPSVDGGGCFEGTALEGGACTTYCNDPNKVPSTPSLLCNDGVLTPTTFTCEDP